jgi:hypothetical protein
MNTNIDADVLHAYDEYIKDGRLFYNPFTKKAIYKNRKNWILWLTRTVGKNKTNQFLFLFEPPHYSKLSNERLGIESFFYNRSIKWASYTKSEIENNEHLNSNRSILSKIRSSNHLIDLNLDECKTKLAEFFNDGIYHNPSTNKIYNSRKSWKDKMGIYFSKSTIHKLCFLIDSPAYSVYSGVPLTLSDYHYYKGFNGFTSEETKSRRWASMTKHIVSSESKKKISDGLIKFHKTEKGQAARQKMRESKLKFDKTEQGKKVREESKIKQSETMKRKIRNNEFTPNITNSWTKWDSVICIDGITKKFRSSWEACFWFCNQHLLFENIRIPSSSGKVYINDFFDESSNTFYEIKPKSRYNIEIHKMQTLIEFCEKNNYRFMWINDSNILDYISEPKILTNESAMIQFKKLKKGINYSK